MKVQIVQTVEVTDEQREALAQLLDGGTGRKRHAKRDEFKEYLWAFGAEWPLALDQGLKPGTPFRFEELLGLPDEDTAEEDEDLLGDDDLLGDVQVTSEADPDLDDLL